MLNLKDINWKKPGLFAAGVAFGTAGIKMIGKWVKCNNCKEIIYKLYSSRIKSKILCDEDCNKRSGECRRYFSRSKADQ